METKQEYDLIQQARELALSKYPDGFNKLQLIECRNEILSKRTISIEATFVGIDGANGFKAQQKYKLVLFHDSHGYIKITNEAELSIRYESVVHFLNNWNNIQTI